MNEDIMTEAERALITADEADGLLEKRGKGVFYIHTLGCQINVHGSRRIAGVPEASGYVPAAEDQINDDNPGLLVLSTCAIHENAVERMYGTTGRLNRIKLIRPNLQITVGSYMVQLDREEITDTAPWVSAVFGTRNIEDLPKLLDQNRVVSEAQVQITKQLRQFPSQFPAARASRIGSRVVVSMGYNNTYTFCIVPTTRGEEKDRRPGDILDETRQCMADSTKEVALSGQDVNSFGYGASDQYALSKLSHACGTIDGLEHVRFTSPHPAAFADDVIAAMVETPNITHRLHFPLQSGSDRILRVMRRSYRSAKFLDVLSRIRTAISNAQISIDIIVGFPDETEEDFQQAMDVIRQARFSSAFTFIYSPRPGTPAAAVEQIPRDVVQSRFDYLVALQEQITEENLATFEGRGVEMMITGKLSKKDTGTHRITGREETGVLVCIGAPKGEPIPEVDDFVTAAVIHAGRRNLLADPDVATDQTYSVWH